MSGQLIFYQKKDASSNEQTMNPPGPCKRIFKYRGIEKWLTHQVFTLENAGSNPAPATMTFWERRERRSYYRCHRHGRYHGRNGHGDPAHEQVLGPDDQQPPARAVLRRWASAHRHQHLHRPAQRRPGLTGRRGRAKPAPTFKEVYHAWHCPAFRFDPAGGPGRSGACPVPGHGPASDYHWNLLLDCASWKESVIL